MDFNWMNFNCKQRLKRLFPAWLAVAALFVAAPAGAVVIVGGDNGWEVSFDGNVNGFYVYEDADPTPTVSNPAPSSFNFTGLGFTNSLGNVGVHGSAQGRAVAPRDDILSGVLDLAKEVLPELIPFLFLDNPLPVSLSGSADVADCRVPSSNTYCHVNVEAGGLVGKLEGVATISDGAEASRVRTGLLPAFFSFNVRSPEVAGLRGSARISFAPQIQNANTKNNFGNGTQAGAQIDLREVFFNIDGSFGTLSVGRTLSLFQRHNILTDMTLFGVGVQGGVDGGGTTLGRIGYGYVYPQFNARISYKTQNVGGFQMEVGAYDPSEICTDNGATCAKGTKKPRFETEITYGTDYDGGSLLGWFGAMWQDAENFNNTTKDVTAWGISGGLQLSYSGFTLTGSGYRGEALGSVLMLDFDSLDMMGGERDNYGWIAQLTYSLGQLKLGVSYGENNSDLTAAESRGGRRGGIANELLGNEVVSRLGCTGRNEAALIACIDNSVQDAEEMPMDDARDKHGINFTSADPLSLPVHIETLSSFTFGAYYDVTPWFKLVGEYSRVENNWHELFGIDPEQQSDVFSLGAFFTW